MAWALMYNNFDQIAAYDCEPTELYRAPQPASAYESPFTASPARGQTSCGHIAVPLHCIPGYEGGVQLDCAVCGKRATHACILCSSKDAVFPLHQPYSAVGHRIQTWGHLTITPPRLLSSHSFPAALLPPYCHPTATNPLPYHRHPTAHCHHHLISQSGSLCSSRWASRRARSLLLSF